MTRAALFIAILLLAPLAGARGDYAIGVTGDRITVAGNDIQGAGGGFEPTDIPNCELWLDASDASTLTMSNVYVTAWADKSGGGHHATQTTLDYRPQVALWTNDVYAVSTDGNDALGSAAFFDTSNHTIMVVAKRNSRRIEDDLAFSGPGITSPGSLILMGYTTKLRASYWPATGSVLYDYTFADVTPKRIYGQMVTDSNIVAVVDGVVVGVTANTTARPTGSYPFIVGKRSAGFGHSGLVGMLAEVVAYDRALTPTEISRLTEYLKTKWSIE